MQGVIEFLEKMGSEAYWRDATHEEIKCALNETNIESPMRSAILQQDARQLQDLMQLPQLFGGLVPGMPDEEGEEEEQEEDEPGEEPEPKDARELTSPSFSLRTHVH